MSSRKSSYFTSKEEFNTAKAASSPSKRQTRSSKQQTIKIKFDDTSAGSESANEIRLNRRKPRKLFHLSKKIQHRNLFCLSIGKLFSTIYRSCELKKMPLLIKWVLSNVQIQQLLQKYNNLVFWFTGETVSSSCFTYAVKPNQRPANICCHGKT